MAINKYEWEVIHMHEEQARAILGDRYDWLTLRRLGFMAERSTEQDIKEAEMIADALVKQILWDAKQGRYL